MVRIHNSINNNNNSYSVTTMSFGRFTLLAFVAAVLLACATAWPYTDIEGGQVAKNKLLEQQAANDREF